MLRHVAVAHCGQQGAFNTLEAKQNIKVEVIGYGHSTSYTVGLKV
jgi:hypothetical protein